MESGRSLWLIFHNCAQGQGMVNSVFFYVRHPPSHWQKKCHLHIQLCGTEGGEISVGVLAASQALWRFFLGSEAMMNIKV